MEITALVLRLIIATVFLVAGLAKLADLKGTRKTVVDFGAPQWAAPLLGLLLPLSELATTILLLRQSTVLWGSVFAIALLFVFVIAISFNLARGRKPDCNCFGQIRSEPVGWPTLARNGLLI